MPSLNEQVARERAGLPPLPPVPDRDRPDFTEFLHWLAQVRHYTTDQIIYVVAKPWKYAEEYAAFLADPEQDR